MTIFAKFEDLWTKVSVKDSSLMKDVADKLKKITWAIFILSKFRILNRKGSPLDFAYLVAAAIHVVIVHAPNDVTSTP